MSHLPTLKEQLINLKTGDLSRTWYSFFRWLASPPIREISADYYADNSTMFLVCSGTIEIFLQSAAKRDNVLTIINVDTGTVTLTPSGSETINGASSDSLTQWQVMRLLPVAGGYVKV